MCNRVMPALAATVLFVLIFAVLRPAEVTGQEFGQVYVEVLDGSGQPVADLTSADFIVTEDDVEMTVVEAEIDRSPMRIALLVDHGHQMNQANATNPLRSALAGFLDTLPPQHEVTLYTIAGNIRRLVDFTTDRGELKDGVGLIFTEGGSGPVFYDSLKETWERRFEDEEPFPVFVAVLSDGNESSGNRWRREDSFIELIDMLVSNRIMVHTVMLETRGGNQLSSVGRQLAEITGGVFENINSATGLPDVLMSLAKRIGDHFDQVSNRYTVVYQRPGQAGARVTLRLNRSGVGVRLFPDRRMQ